jgi:lipoprotein NlpI
MSTTQIAVTLVWSVAFLVMGIEAAYQKRTTGRVDMKTTMRWFGGTILAAILLLTVMFGYDMASGGRMKTAVADIQAGSEAAKRQDFDTAIPLYTRAIDAKTLPDSVVTETLRARAGAYLGKGDFAQAVDDFNRVIERKPDDATSYWGLGTAYAEQGQPDKAIRAFDRVIEMKPTEANLFVDSLDGRGSAYSDQSQYERAMQDFDQAVRLQPDNGTSHGMRGDTAFYLGRFQDAETDLRIASDSEPKTAYYALWLHLAAAHQGKDDHIELSQRAEKLDVKAWPGPVVQFYLGKQSADEVLAAARAGGAKIQYDQQCEANFYMGEQALLSGDTTQARRLFGEALNNCDKRFIEYSGAKAEMSRLGE